MIIDYLVLKQLQVWLLMLILYWWIIDNHSIKIPRSVLKQLQVSKLFFKITSRHGRLYQIQTNRYFLSDTIVAFRKQALQIKYCSFQLPFSEYWVAVALGGYRSALVLSLSFIMWASFYYNHYHTLSFIMWAFSITIIYHISCLLSYELFILCNNRNHICDGGYTTSFTSTLSAPYLSPRHRPCSLSYPPPCQHNQPRYRAPRRAAYLGSGSLVALGGASLGCYRLQSILRLTVGHPHISYTGWFFLLVRPKND